ncbi:Intradiol ring-cleavage dioxygenase [Xylariaceae sp. FL0016]|nr:Intradiol ring-cleavage dioxygenase [Xylariaceae sp. FL0016]
MRQVLPAQVACAVLKSRGSRTVPRAMVAYCSVSGSPSVQSLAFCTYLPNRKVNSTCALVPGATVGSYYVTGEEVRSDIAQGQAGVPLHLELQLLNKNACEAVTDLITDIWHCNYMGWYCTVALRTKVGSLNSTFMRGVQISDDEGVVELDTAFPSHYDRRLTHIHGHIGQLHFDDALIREVEATGNYNPYLEYVQLGSVITDGLMSWITSVVDVHSNRSFNLTAAAHYDEGDSEAVDSDSGSGPPLKC